MSLSIYSFIHISLSVFCNQSTITLPVESFLLIILIQLLKFPLFINLFFYPLFLSIITPLHSSTILFFWSLSERTSPNNTTLFVILYILSLRLFSQVSSVTLYTRQRSLRRHCQITFRREAFAGLSYRVVYDIYDIHYYSDGIINVKNNTCYCLRTPIVF